MRKFIAYFIFCVSFFTQGQQEKTLQDTLLKQVKADYQDYFAESRESIFLHLNKNVFIPGEDLWFSAYAYNPKFGIPHEMTTNLKVSLVNEKGETLETKTIYINKGKGKGYFSLDSLATKPGTYGLWARTDFMKNFKEDHSFYTDFKILPQSDNEVFPTKKEIAYDLQYLPEGGHLIYNCLNSVGVKLIDNSGKGIPFENAIITDETGTVVTNFNSNQFGIAKFQFTPKPGKEYSILLKKLSGKSISKKITGIDNEGLTMIVNNLIPDKVVVSIHTNPKSAENLKGKTFYLAIHKNGILQSIPFSFAKGSHVVDLQFPRKILVSGINILTVFTNNKKPVLERLIYNHTSKNNGIHAYLKKNFVDSLQLNFTAKELIGKKHQFSVSVLPGKTKAYQPKHSILSAFLLTPYLKGNIEKAWYYFDEPDRRKMYHLDLLLLTQGWSRYNWNSIFNSSPSIRFKHQQGFTLKGKLNEKLKKNEAELFISCKETGLMTIVSLDKENTFEYKNAYIEDSTSVSFSLINNKRKKLSIPKIGATIYPLKNDEAISKSAKNRFLSRKSPQNIINNQVIPEDFIRKQEVIDSVFIKSVSKETAIKSKEISTNTTVIDEYLEESYFYLTDLLQAKGGFWINRSASGVSIKSPRAVSLGGYGSPLVIIDDVPGDYSTILSNLRTSEVESVTINKTGFGHGMRGSAGVIEIKLKTFIDNPDKKNIQSQEFTATNGFSPNKAFYKPKYASYTSTYYEKFGAIDWFPDLQLNENGQLSLKIENTIQDSIYLFIEGMTEDGEFISHRLEVRIKK